MRLPLGDEGQHGDGEAHLRRVGECSGCGACCRFIVLQVNPQYAENPDVARWIGLHGIRLAKKGQGVWAYIPAPCSKLTEDKHCAIHETRPQVCRVWPSSEADLGELAAYLEEQPCSYSFTKEGTR